MQQWGTPPQPSPRRDKFVWLLALVVVVSIIGGGLYAFSSSADLQGLTAGLLGQPTGGPAHTPLPIASTSTAAPAASATPDPSAKVPANDALALFTQLGRTANLPMHLNMTVAIKSSQHGNGGFSMSIDMSGRSMAGTINLRMGGKRVGGPFLVVNGDWYFRSGSNWVRKPNPGMFNPQPSLLPQSGDLGLVYVGTAQGDPRDLVHLRGTALPAPDMSGSIRASGCRQLPAVDYWVRPDGTPVSATFGESCDLPGNKQSIKVTIQFSDVGKAVEIVAPA